MEENNINLGQNVAGYQQSMQTQIPTSGYSVPQQQYQPISVQSESTTIPQVQPQTITTTQPVVDIQSNTTQVMNEVQNNIISGVAPLQPAQQEQPVQEDIKQEPVSEENMTPVQIDSSKYIVRTDLLKSYIKTIMPASINKSAVLTTTVIQMVFDTDGLILKATDGENVITIKDSQFKFDNKVSMCVKSEVIDKLISCINTPYIELTQDTEDHIIIIHADKNIYRISAIHDSDGTPLVVPESFALTGNEEKIKIDFETFKLQINKSLNFVSSQSVRGDLAGVYFKDIVIGTDKNYMIAMPNQPELLNKTLYVPNTFCNIVVSANLNSESYICTTTNSNNEEGIAITDGKITITGPMHPQKADYPVDIIMSVMQKPLSHGFDIDKSKYENALSLVKLFLNYKDKKPGDTLSDKGACKYTIDPVTSTLCISDMDGHTEQYIDITNCDNVVAQEFWMNVEKCEMAIKNYDGGNINFRYTINEGNGSYIILDAQDTKELLSVIE